MGDAMGRIGRKVSSGTGSTCTSWLSLSQLFFTKRHSNWKRLLDERGVGQQLGLLEQRGVHHFLSARPPMKVSSSRSVRESPREGASKSTCMRFRARRAASFARTTSVEPVCVTSANSAHQRRVLAVQLDDLDHRGAARPEADGSLLSSFVVGAPPRSRACGG